MKERIKAKRKAQSAKRRRQIFCFLFSVFCFLSSVSAQETRYAFNKADRDPFSPLISKSGVILIARKIDIGGLGLKGIIYSETASIAIINDEVVRKGDKIGEYFVSEIEEKRVILRKNDEEFILKLEEEE